eukprot:TRINITY_DN26526_c0_g1_i1.p1 TRINITY_DN26526_c0_g1~~TRINITY_DN26526_c0_g1_i1.p1  ORF type:complete len:469 (-),score=231.46 TRINITY_DN26526_c0_g1_i1:48-1454(-)
MASKLLNLVPRMGARKVAGLRSYASVPSYLLNTPTTKVTKLANGIQVATEEWPGETATVGVWIGAGSAFENEKNNGVAHFLEHMAFKGTSKRSATQLEMEIENIGAHLNAYTSREHTCYFARSFKKDVPQVVDVLADILQNSNYKEDAIEREKSTIVRELQEVENNMDEVIFDYLHSAAYQGTSLGRTILGPESNIKSITRDDLVNYVKTYYTGPRMVISAAGAVKHEELVKQVESAFSTISAQDNVGETTKSVPVEFTGSEIKVRNDELPLVYTTVAVEGVGWTHPDYYVMLVLQTLLGNWDKTAGGGNNLASRLAELVATEQLCESINTFNISYGSTSLFGNYAIVKGNKSEDTVCEILQEWQRIGNGATHNEVERAKNKLKASLMMQLDGTSAIADNIGKQMLSIGRVMPPAEVFMRINSITVADVKRVAYSYLTDVSPAVVAIGPTEFFPDYNQVRSWTYWNRM